MSGWDAPTGNWDTREEPEESGGPDEQGYQQESTGGYRTVRGGEGRLRAGRRGLPGYDQAQPYDQAGGYDQGSGYGPGPGYGQPPGYGPGPGTGPSAQSPAGTGPQRTSGSGPNHPVSSVPPRAIGSGPRTAVGYGDTAAGGFPGYGSAEATRQSSP